MYLSLHPSGFHATLLHIFNGLLLDKVSQPTISVRSQSFSVRSVFELYADLSP